MTNDVNFIEWTHTLKSVALASPYYYIIFTELTPRPIQSESCDVRVSVDLCVCLSPPSEIYDPKGPLPDLKAEVNKI